MTLEPNLYRPPIAEVADIEQPSSLESASKWRRLGTLVVDYVGYTLLTVLFDVAVLLTFRMPGVKAIQSVPEFLLGGFLLFCYYVFFEGIWARTPGKLVFGTVVTTEKGLKPSFGRVLKRTLCRFIPFEQLSFFGQRGWHDGISNTRVVLRRKP